MRTKKVTVLPYDGAWKTDFEKIKAEKIIVIVRGVKKDKLVPLAEAMYQGGIRLLEVVYDANGDVSDEDTAIVP